MPMVTDAEWVIEEGDGQAEAGKHPVVLILDNLRSAYNVGNIFRLAEVCRLEAIYTCGYTATPPHPKLTKTARGCDQLVPCEHRSTAVEAVQELQNKGYQVVGIETVAGAAAVWDFEFVFPSALVFGNEALGIHQDALSRCDNVARLPVFGQKNSLNVGNCAAVAVYAAIQQYSGRNL